MISKRVVVQLGEKTATSFATHYYNCEKLASGVELWEFSTMLDVRRWKTSFTWGHKMKPKNKPERHMTNEEHEQEFTGHYWNMRVLEHRREMERNKAMGIIIASPTVAEDSDDDDDDEIIVEGNKTI